MAKVLEVKSARKDHNCVRCGVKIEKGQSYKHVSPGFRGPKLIRCLKPECFFRQSELTTSKLSGAYAAIETAEENVSEWNGDAQDLKSLLDDCADELDGVAEEYREASSSWGDGNGNEEWDEMADQIETFAQELRDYEVCDADGNFVEVEETEEVTSMDSDAMQANIDAVSDLLSGFPL